jgi:hypothetical protein
MKSMGAGKAWECPPAARADAHYPAVTTTSAGGSSRAPRHARPSATVHMDSHGPSHTGLDSL